MPTMKDLVNEEAVKIIEEPTPVMPKSKSFDIMKVLMRPAKDEPLDSYLTHPLNFDKTESTAKIVRGLEGLMGNLNLAIMDIVAGVIEKVQKKPKVVKLETNNT